jgi:hypothetical protein
VVTAWLRQAAAQGRDGDSGRLVLGRLDLWGAVRLAFDLEDDGSLHNSVRQAPERFDGKGANGQSSHFKL